MKSTTTFIILSFFILFSCKQNARYQPSNLTKVTDEQLIQNAKNHDLPNPESLIYKSITGEILTLDTLRRIEDPTSIALDYYQNSAGTIVEAIIRKSTDKDKALIKKIDAAFNEGPDVKTVEVDCENKNQILNDTYERDQGMRTDKRAFDPQVDHENLQIIISFIEQCGMPTLKEVSKKEIAAVWLVLQHAPPKYQSKYIPMLEEAAQRGDISWGTIALMKDRALLHEGKPQIYGSQVSNGKIYDLQEPEYVNQRRAKMDMEPIEDYLKRFGIEFNVEQKTK